MYSQKIVAYTFIVLVLSAILVHGRPQMLDLEEREAEPGWLKQQLIRASEVAGRAGNHVGGFAVRLSNAVDRVCQIVKKIIPIVGAVCSVGKFKFCALDANTSGLENFGGTLPVAGPGGVDLNVQD